MLYSPKSIANYFIDLANANGEHISPMKLQKLVYYAMGWFAGHTGQRLVDEDVEAWQYGPVFPSLYQEFKRFGAGKISEKAKETPFNSDYAPVPTDSDIRKFLDNIWNSYGKYTGIALSEMTHATGSPWDITWQNSAGVRNMGIPHSLIQTHFKQVIENAKARSTVS